MKIVVLGTGSKGNCYIAKSNNNKFIILDCGIKFEEITSNNEFNSFKNCDFVFASHIHPTMTITKA